MSFNTISVIGLGYIGLPTAAMFAARKLKVIGVDVNQHAVDTINRGEIHIVEPDLDVMVHDAVVGGYLKAVVTPEPADAFLIAVPTPFRSDGSNIPEPDLSYIKNAIEAIAPVLKKGDLVVLESTSPVGATEKMVEWLAVARPDLVFPAAVNADSHVDIHVAYCPERVLPGHVVHELVENDRVIGGMTAACSARVKALYEVFVEGECVITNSRTAEMAKLTENSCRDVQIAFANELSIICDKLDIDVWELIRLANRHPRINILEPGPGVGGHCIAVDPWFIVSKTPHEAKLIRAAREVNDSKPHWVVAKIKSKILEYLNNNVDKQVTDVTLAIYGLAFKPNIDDLRESPALRIATEISEFHSGTTLVVEPNIDCSNVNLGELKLVELSTAKTEADVHVLLVDHHQFKQCCVTSEYLVDVKGIW